MCFAYYFKMITSCGQTARNMHWSIPYYVVQKNKSRVSKHIYTITVPAPKIKRTLICPTEFQTGVVRTGMGSVYKVDWSHKCLSPGANPSNSIDTLGAGQDGCVLLCEGQPDPLQVLPGKHLQAASAPAGVSQTKIDLTSDHF